MLLILTTIAVLTNEAWALCSFPLPATPRGMSEFISSEYTSPITRTGMAATIAVKPIMKIAEPMSVVSLVCSAKGDSSGVNVSPIVPAFQPAQFHVKFYMALVWRNMFGCPARPPWKIILWHVLWLCCQSDNMFPKETGLFCVNGTFFFYFSNISIGNSTICIPILGSICLIKAPGIQGKLCCLQLHNWHFHRLVFNGRKCSESPWRPTQSTLIWIFTVDL